VSTGSRGEEIEYTVPAYDENKCLSGRFGIFCEDHPVDESGAPNLWARTPGQRNRIRIVDVDGTRLVILAGYPPTISKKDRTDLDALLESVRIG
jgi:hypothetical protein